MKRAGFVATLPFAIVLAGLPWSSEVEALAPPALQQGKQMPVTVKLTIVISRFEGEKKTGSLPFVLMIVPRALPADGAPAGSERDGEATSLQVGSQYPYPSTTITDGKAVASTKWESLGTQITAAGRMMADGFFNVFVSVQDSQIWGDPAAAGALPRFQNFRSSNRLILRDGQTIQYTAAADKTSGEVIKLDVTLNVMK